MAATPSSSSIAAQSSRVSHVSNGAVFDLGPPHGIITLTISNVSHRVSLKLDRSNYLLWRSQFLPVLYSQGVMGFVNGSITPPPALIPNEEHSSLISNPAYEAWFRVDQTIQSWILSTLSPGALGQLLGLTTAHTMWVSLEQAYASSLHSRVLQLRLELQNLKRGTLSILEYLERGKSIADNLSAAGQPVDQEDLVAYILNGLGSEYEPFIMSVTARTDPLSLESLQSMLLSQEHRLNVTTQLGGLTLSNTVPSASMANHTNTSSRGRGGRSTSRGRGRGGGRSTPNSTHAQNNKPRPDTRPSCQICSKKGHSRPTAVTGLIKLSKQLHLHH
ncbi:hypothetical protein H6P81_015871 [Aristolochia fimbriata]|uniref:Retrotransposon Copia-like N-terminal domain-containing protein n=1 Tax=Aristolochia fimbriata TaxID=158543 RepID=A0AAV7E800_ARIFI|nr:hypothetical protein H6P81_015871 [Aristolochia fimbriata]